MRNAALALLLLLVPAGTARAQTATCDDLEGGEKKLADDLLGSLKGYGCCDGKLAACLKDRPACKLATRLADAVCRQILLGADEREVRESFARRRTSMDPAGSRASLTLDEAARAGDPKAPVTAVLFVCARCPFCRGATLDLYREVTEDRLAGKVKLYLRPFPLKSHEGATEGGLAFVAAARQDKLWPFATFLYRNFDRFHPEMLGDWARSAGLDPAAFEQAMADPSTREALAGIKKEGVRHGVTSTPSLFVNGRRFTYSLETAEVVDALLEESARVSDE